MLKDELLVRVRTRENLEFLAPVQRLLGLWLYLLPRTSIHKAGEVARVCGGYDHLLAALFQNARLGSDNHVNVQLALRAGRWASPACGRPPRVLRR